MQNTRYLDNCIKELCIYFPQTEIIEGDRYCPISAIKISDCELPPSVIEDSTDIVIPMARCAGYLPGAALAGIHVSALHGYFRREKTLIPFCDPVEDLSWMESTKRFYPHYESDPEYYLNTHYLCLNDPGDQPETPLALMDTALEYLSHWSDNAMNLAQHHGHVVRGIEAGDIENSQDWLDHLVEHVSENTKKELLSIAFD